MEIRQVKADKKKYLNLLLLADEQEDMIDKYLERGEMFVLDDDGVKANALLRKSQMVFMNLKALPFCPVVSVKDTGNSSSNL